MRLKYELEVNYASDHYKLDCCIRSKTSDFKQAAVVEVAQAGKLGMGEMGTGKVLDVVAQGGGGTEQMSG